MESTNIWSSQSWKMGAQPSATLGAHPEPVLLEDPHTISHQDRYPRDCSNCFKMCQQLSQQNQLLGIYKVPVKLSCYSCLGSAGTF